MKLSLRFPPFEFGAASDVPLPLFSPPEAEISGLFPR
jgi:hypothetical protein